MSVNDHALNIEVMVEGNAAMLAADQCCGLASAVEAQPTP